MTDPRRISLLAALSAAVVILAVPAALGQSLYDQKQDVDQAIYGLRSEIERAKERAGALESQIGAASAEIKSLESDIGILSARVAELERDLAAHRDRLARLRDRFEEQTRQLNHLKRQHALAIQRLEERLVQIYETEEADELDIFLRVQSLGELIEQVDYFNEIGRQDRQIADELRRLKVEMRAARKRTAVTKAKVAKATAILSAKTAEQRAARDALLAREAELESARASDRSELGDVEESREESEEELDALLASSAALAAEIQSAQGSSSGGSTGSGVSSSGFIWPVNGVVTSGFGPRWGRMHEGIDIAAPGGTPVRAAASGQVIYAGSLGGYGNLVVIDHGNGLATAYAHLSAIWVGGGSVSQGQGIGAVGSTGHSTGNHLHFEVRVNGSPVDPMAYL